jgi:glycerophosphoryl diester phosphodiesterase
MRLPAPPALVALLIVLSIALLAACETVANDPQPPVFPNDGLLATATQLAERALLPLEGVYQTSSRFGDDVVLHSTRSTLSILALDHLAYAIMKPGCLPGTSGPRLVLEGYWRYLDGTDTGLVRLFVGPDSLAAELCAGNPPQPASLPATLTGATGIGSNEPYVPLTVSFSRARKSRLVAGRKSFLVGAHHGGCQSLDKCGVSENSSDTFPLAEQLGADFVEIDVRLTADGVPFPLHHTKLGDGLVNGAYCYGNSDDFTFVQLQANCRLVNGEKLETLAQVIESGLTRTDTAIWLDMKSPEALAPTFDVLRELTARLPGANVTQRVVMGLPADDVVDAYEEFRNAGQLPPGQRCLVEADPDDVERLGCMAWMPRYTVGPRREDIARLQAQGHFAGYWTINDRDVMDAFLREGRPNGVITNYLGLLAQRFEAVGILPDAPLPEDIDPQNAVTP